MNDPHVRITALVCVTLVMLAFVWTIARSQGSTITYWFAPIVASVVPAIVAAFKADETARKVEQVAGTASAIHTVAEKIEDQTNGKLRDTIRAMMREELSRLYERKDDARES